ncbi:histamine N-methyltransferase B-like [Ptychodera flava]|uniref:histamine N-methyltransferase B-like n=1 Tax=Ptychodera flava TaxID=63121 RepID=UPI00396A1E46
MQGKQISLQMTSADWYRSLKADADSYFQAFTAYRKRTDRHKNTLQMFSDAVPSLIIDNKDNNDKSVFEYLGVGCGAGLSDLTLLRQLRRRFPSIKATMVEPSSKFLEEFNQNRVNAPNDLDDVTFDCRQATFDEYQQSCEGARFDCVCGISVLEYVVDIDRLISWMYSALKENGSLVLFFTSENNVLLKFWTHSDQRDIHLIKPSLVEKLLEKHNVRKIDRLELDSTINITECFEETSEAGSRLLDFVTHAASFRRSAPTEMLREVLDYLSRNSVGKDDGIYAPNNFTCLVVQK